MRINKYIAEAGVASRRGADELIKAGRVSVNSKKITECGIDINIENDTVMVDGRKIARVTRYTYVMFNKPKGCITTQKDEFDRTTIFDYLKQFESKKLFSIGRLDYESEGLLLLTNDGQLAQQLTHPSFEVPKTYVVRVEGKITEDSVKQIRKGVTASDGTEFAPARVKVLEILEEDATRIEITVSEGKNREVRRIFEAVGHNVVLLRRKAIGDLQLGGLSRGSSRYLTDKEVAYLKRI